MYQDDPGKDLDVKTQKLPQIFKSKLFLIIAGSILAVAVVGGIYGIFVLPNSTDSDQIVSEQGDNGLKTDNSETTDTAEVLPQFKRIDEQNENNSWSTFEPLVDPFSDPMRLTGLVLGGRGGAMAIIESSGTSYLVLKGDYVDDLWAVYQVTSDLVILRAHNQEVTLYLDQPPVTRALDYDREVEEDVSEEGS